MKRFWRLHRLHYRDTMRLSLPVMISQLGQITVGLADNMMVGRLGTTELAAAAFANMLVSLPLFFGMGFALSLTPLVGKAYGANDMTAIGSYFRHGLLSNALVGLLLVAVCGGLYLMMPLMHQPGSILGIAQSYFIYIALSMFPTMLFLMGKQLCEGMADTKSAMLVTIVGNILHIGSNYALIFGKLGLPALGVEGAGISTLLSRIFMATAMLVLVFRKPIIRHALQLSKLLRLRIAVVRELVWLGVPMGIHVFSEASAFIFAGIMMGWLGEVGLAAHQIVISLSGLGFMLYQAIGFSTTIRISQLSALEMPSLIKRASVSSSQIVTAMVMVVSAIFLIFHRQIPYLFTSSDEVAHVASKLIIVFVVFQVFDATQIVFSGILRGLADAKIPSMLTVISYYLIAIPTSYLAAFRFGFGEVGIWFGFPIGLGICSLLFLLRIRMLIGRMEPLRCR
ncbi:MATE family efflux transporter [Acetobacteroides hydrogenigenes]|uniref:Multidrug-efflux transporter n=1 Tax=Acetobacteroides hydrogenigenes TaxID=979970 RepID=A0A4R2EVD0_9BACT|nr:MATE family efflux transporter [Acetobacteroides hydrogenigenes]TCN68599.1 MATE family multidrug resistance protein [Acetobacteroides hydrogenigenes]